MSTLRAIPILEGLSLMFPKATEIIEFKKEVKIVSHIHEAPITAFRSSFLNENIFAEGPEILKVGLIRYELRNISEYYGLDLGKRFMYIGQCKMCGKVWYHSDCKIMILKEEKQMRCRHSSDNINCKIVSKKCTFGIGPDEKRCAGESGAIINYLKCLGTYDKVKNDPKYTNK